MSTLSWGLPATQPFRATGSTNPAKYDQIKGRAQFGRRSDGVACAAGLRWPDAAGAAPVDPVDRVADSGQHPGGQGHSAKVGLKGCYTEFFLQYPEQVEIFLYT